MLERKSAPVVNAPPAPVAFEGRFWMRVAAAACMWQRRWHAAANAETKIAAPRRSGTRRSIGTTEKSVTPGK
jgi:hypothetical protein